MAQLKEQKLPYRPELKFRQLRYESNTWKRWLDFIVDENINNKNRISEILRQDFDPNLLDQLENFQDGFIQEDTRVSFLRNELTEFDQLLAREIFEHGQIKKDIIHRLKQIRSHMALANRSFSSLQTVFNNYLLENIR